MKTNLFAVAMVVLSIFAFAGCANESSNAASAGANPTDRTYTQKDLNNTGRHDTAGAAQAIDPSVTISSGGGGGAHP
jgi:PBP1b-binding outer membrane lipoprotein LpoB